MPKKTFVQDVIPSNKSIRNVTLSSKFKKYQKEEAVTYEYDEPVKPSKTLLYVSIVLFILAAAFGVSALFKSAIVRVTPKQEVRVLNSNFRALKNITSGNLGFQTVTTVKDVEKTVTGTSEQQVMKKARGTIVIYNNTAQWQKLRATTRFQTAEGLIFRALQPVNIPPKQVKNGKAVAGSVESAVEADKAGPIYNIGLKDFTIPGFKGDSKYKQIYARSKTEMIGGFSGMQKIISKEVLDQADKDLGDELRASLLKDITSQIPDNFVLYSNGLFYNFQPITQGSVAASQDSQTNNVVLKKKGAISAIIFDKGSLSRAIITKVLPDENQDIIKVTDLGSLNFTLQGSASFDPNTTTSIDFNLSGDSNLVWVFDENKLKTELLGLSKKNANMVVASYSSIKEAWILTYPFWNQSIPTDPKKVTLINTLTK